MRWILKREILPFIIIAMYIFLAVYFYPLLPEKVPSHFNSRGVPDQYSAKSHVIWLSLGLPLGLYLILTFIPFIDPFWRRIQKRYSIFLLLRDFMLLFFLFYFLLVIVSAKQGKLQTNVLGIGLGFLFILVGNYLPKLPRNFFFGVRSPWALASDIVWKKTHILCGWVFTLGGVLTIVLSLLKISLALALGVTLGPAVLFSGFLYPLLLYKKLEREEKLKSPQL